MPWKKILNFVWLAGATALCGLLFLWPASVPQVSAQTASSTSQSDLQQQIDEHTATINELNQEITTYQQQLDATTKQAKTLQSAVSSLTTTQKKLGTSIQVTQNQISTANLTIQQLQDEITQKQNQIVDNKAALGESLRNLNHADQVSLIEALFSGNSLDTFWNDVQSLKNFQGQVKQNTDNLNDLEISLQDDESQREGQKQSLVTYQGQLSDQKKAVDATASEKSQLLSQTKDQESNYQALLTDRLAKYNAFQKELLQFESQLNLTINPTSIPQFGAGVLHPPLAKLTITQQFGDTDFARTHAQAYNGMGHDGTDFAASIGTPVMAALDGIVKGTGNTDPVCYKASYGKWILIQHDNGLDTLYAHLSVIKVTTGQEVKTGDIIALSGDTGYTTGPHLHFGVLATEGTEIAQKKSAVCQGTYTMPLADLKAYLNPMLYL